MQVDLLNCIAMYNKYMGGTDQMDENVARHRIGFRGKKWWWSIFTWLIDVALTNAWRLNKNAGKNSTFLEFRRSIIQEYLIRFKTSQKKKRPSSSTVRITSRVFEGICYDRIIDHYVIQTEKGKRKRCASDI